MIIKIGIDLAKHHTGYAIVVDGVVKISREFSIWDYDNVEPMDSMELSHRVSYLVRDICRDLLMSINCWLTDYKVEVGIETADFLNFNANKTNVIEMNFISGMLFQEIYHKLFGIFGKFAGVKIKVFNANEWYKWIGKVTDKTEKRKAITKEMTGAKNDNIADAMLIASYVPNCKDRIVKHKLTKLMKEYKKAKTDKKKQKIMEEIEKYETI